VVLDLVVNKTDDGYTAEVPSIKGCETWASDEDEAINKVLELVYFYLHLPVESFIKVDRARKHSNKIVYKIIFDKDSR
jgi:predicted RNase H-like HicB family nuclease